MTRISMNKPFALESSIVEASTHPHEINNLMTLAKRNVLITFGWRLEKRERVKKKGPDNIANNKKLHVVVC